MVSLRNEFLNIKFIGHNDRYWNNGQDNSTVDRYEVLKVMTYYLATEYYFNNLTFSSLFPSASSSIPSAISSWIPSLSWFSTLLIACLVLIDRAISGCCLLSIPDENVAKIEHE